MGRVGRLRGAPAPLGRFVLLASLAVAGLALGLYANALRGAFQFDDATSILENETLRSGNPLHWWGFWPGRMMAYTSLALDWHRYGLNPLGYHVTNALIHALAGVAVLWLAIGLARLTRRARPAEPAQPALQAHPALPADPALQAHPPSGAPWLGLAAAAVFVAHPLQTQAVAYITQRMASLYTLFYVAAVAAYVQGLTRLARGQSRGWAHALAWGCGLLAVLTKEPALTLPIAVALVDFAVAPLAQGRWRRVGPYLPLALVPLVVAWLGGERFGADEASLTAQTARVSRSTYLFTQIEVLARYLRLLVWPVGQNIDHDMPWRSSVLAAPVLLAGLLHLALWTVAVLRWRRGGRLLPLAIAWWYLTLLPESSVFPIADAMVEHRLYAAMPGFALAVALPLEWLWRRRRAGATLAPVALLALVAALGTATVARNRVWHDPYALWRDALAKSPAKGRPYAALGWLHHKAGREAMAVEKLEQAVALDARDPQAWNNLGLACQALGRHERAAEAFQAAVKLRPLEATLWSNLATALQTLGRHQEAARARESAAASTTR